MSAKKRTFPAADAGFHNHVSVVSTTVAFALSQGMSIDDIRAATGMEMVTLADADARLPDDMAPRLWRALAARTDGSVALTIESAKAMPFSLMGGLAHGIQFAGDLRGALQFMSNHRVVIADRLDLKLHEGDADAVMTSEHPSDEIDQGRLSEVGTAVGVRMIREILQIEGAISRVEFRYAPLGPVSDYEAFFRVPVSFGKPRNAVFLHREALDQSVEQANATLFEFVERHFAEVLGRLESTHVPADLARLQRAIADGAARGDYRATTVAGRAQLSLRQARRIAARHDTSLHAMIDEMRASNARAFLLDPSSSLETVSSLLGYSDDRAFRRAFKRWTGEPPSAYRRKHV